MRPWHALNSAELSELWLSAAAQVCRAQQRPQQLGGADLQAGGAGSAPAGKRQGSAEQQADAPDSPARAVRQCTAHARSRLHAHGSPREGQEVYSHSHAAPPPADASPTHAGEEDTLTLAELGLTDELLGAGQYGYTFKVTSEGFTPTCLLLSTPVSS